MIAVVTFALILPATADASVCSGGGHTLSLSGGGVSPATGTTSTQFEFSVTYKDSGNCAPTVPDYVSVTINGLGTYVLSGADTNYDQGVVFRRRIVITKPGTYGYSFKATSGSKSVVLAGVSPTTFQVAAATPPPTPKPTPPPTAKPTPPPTAKPTPPPTPKPTPPPTPKPTPPPTSGSSVPTASPVEPTTGPTPGEPGNSAGPSVDASPTPTPTALPAGSGGPGSSAQPQPGAALGTPPGGMVRLATWAAVTAGGLGLFLVLARRRRDDDPADAMDGGPVPAHVATSMIEAASAMTSVSRDEAEMPRWLRPSVQAARRRSIRD